MKKIEIINIFKNFTRIQIIVILFLIPIGYLLGYAVGERIFEPFNKVEHDYTEILNK